MNQREQILLQVLSDRLRTFGIELIEEGWRPELVVLADEESSEASLLKRIPGLKVALVVPLESRLPLAEQGSAPAEHESLRTEHESERPEP